MSGGFGGLAEVLDGIEHARRAGLEPIKINAVVQRGVNDHTALELVERFRGTGVIVRFIEYMDVGNRNDWRSELVVPSKELAARIARALAADLARARLSRRGGRALRVRRRPGRGRLHLLGIAAVLRRLLARPAVFRRRDLHLPVRHPRHEPARCAARRRERRTAARDDRGRVAASAPTATASCARACPGRSASSARSRCSTSVADEPRPLPRARLARTRLPAGRRASRTSTRATARPWWMSAPRR